MPKPYLLRLSVFHRGCTLSEFFKKSKLQAKIPFIVRESLDKVSFIIVIENNFNVHYIRRELLRGSDIIEVEILGKRPYPVLFVRKYTRGILNMLAYAGGILIPPITIDYGLKTFNAILDKRSGISYVVKQVNSDSSISRKVIEYHRIAGASLEELFGAMLNSLFKFILSPRELEIIKECYRKGLFNTHKGYNIRKSSLAYMLGLSHSTLIQHLKHAEKKIFKYLLYDENM